MQTLEQPFVTHHELTGLPNRFALEAEVQTLIENQPGTFGLVAIDLDGLKEVNDTLGHPEGDAYLRNFGSILSTLVRNEDDGRSADLIGLGMAAHVSGDEYWVILRDATDQSSIDAFIGRAHSELEDLGIGASMGGKVHDGESAKDLFRLADKLMYENKLQRVPKLDDHEIAKLFHAVGVLEQLGIAPRDVPKYLAAIALQHKSDYALA